MNMTDVDYYSKKLRLNLNIPLRLEAKQEEEATNRIIEDERRYETEVRIPVYYSKNKYLFYFTGHLGIVHVHI